MANEVSITTTYSFNDILGVNGRNNFSYSITGSHGVGFVQNIPAGQSVALSITGLTDIRYLYLESASTGNNVSVSLNSGQSQIASVIRPLESVVLTPSPNTSIATGFWASGVSGAVQLIVCANES